MMNERPSFIIEDLTGYDIASINHGGCASGAYMPAVTHHKALETMSQCGDEVFDYIFERTGEIPSPKDRSSWAGMATFYLSHAVELYAIEMAGEE